MKPEEIETHILAQNNKPIVDFLGLSANQMHYLLYEPFGRDSPVQFRAESDGATLDKISLFRILEEYLKIIRRDKYIKLTPLGALPKKVMVELYDKRFLLDHHIESGLTKLWKEDDCISIRSMRLTAELAGLVKKTHGKLTLTKKSEKLLDTNDRSQLFRLFFQAFTDKYNWGYNDGYPDQPVGQLGWAFSVLMLHRFGDEPRTSDFYATRYQKAFPHFVRYFDGGFSTPEEKFRRCYSLRVFERFLFWFGFVEADRQKPFFKSETDTFTRTALLNGIFEIGGKM